MQVDIMQDTYKDRMKWWNNSRYELNKGLMFGGLTVILVSGIIFQFLMTNSSDNPGMSAGYFLFALVVYIFYLGIVNLIFIVIEMFDRTFSKDDNLKTRNKLFRVFFWLVLTIPFIYPIFLLTMEFSH